ncbi:MAG: helix-turn-helix transcriptional regulator [Dehalococcoidia bacterium]|nr:helix-turn-helix transcriptional regulator [Dehalococcoidia bacterium]
MQGLRNIEGYHNNFGPAMAMTLTQRETEILRLVALGQGNRVIGVSLGISLRTVKVHMANIFEKLDVNRRMDAVAMLSTRAYWQEAKAS